MAFTTTTGANGVVSLVGTSGVDADAAIIYSSMVSIDGFGDNDIIGVVSATGQSFVSEFTVIGGQGNDSISVGTAAFQTALVNSAIWGDSIETIDGAQVVGSGDDIITIGVAQNSTVLGLGGADSITTGTLSNADINGNEGIDTITVNAFDGGVTASFIRGGQQDDTIRVSAGTLVSSHINGNKGADFIEVDVINGVVDTTVYGGQGNDFINASAVTVAADGTVTNVTTSSSAAGFVISGDLGNDTLWGSGRKDTISGGEGNDFIEGFNGADELIGGAGKDTFTQNLLASVAGAFVAGTAPNTGTVTFANGVDVITDFVAGEDSIDGTAAPQANLVFQGSWNGTVFTSNGVAGAAGVTGSAFLVTTDGLDTVDDASAYIVIGGNPLTTVV